MKATAKQKLERRKIAMLHEFELTKETFDQFRQINDNLLDLYNRMVDKMAALYSSWLDTEEEGWNNDCEVIGKIF